MNRLIQSIFILLTFSLPVSADVVFDAKPIGSGSYGFGRYECDHLQIKAGMTMRVIPMRGATDEETIDVRVCTSYKGEFKTWSCEGIGMEVSPKWMYYNGEARPKCSGGCYPHEFKGLVSKRCRKKCPADEYLLAFTSPDKCSPEIQHKADPDQGLTCPMVANPINPATGNKFQQENDLGILSRIPFTRSYNSAAWSTDTGAGKGWRHNWQMRVVPIIESSDPILTPPPDDLDPDQPWSPGTGGPAIVRFYRLERADGASVATLPTGALTSPFNPRHLQLTIKADGFTLNTPQTIEQYDAKGNLTALQNVGGRSYTLSYQNGQLTQVNEVGSAYSLTFNYDATTKRLSKVETKGKASVAYGYDTDGFLTSVTYPDKTQQQYRYDDAKVPGRLAGLIDESQKRFATWAYDEIARAVRSEHGNGTEVTTLRHLGRNHNTFHDGTMTEVILPSGAMHRYKFKKIGDTTVCVSGDKADGPGQGTNTIFAKQYDDTGNLIESTDASYANTRYENDPVRQLEIKRTEYVGTPEQRVITTEWHPTFELPTRITEPKRRSDFTYDAKGNLITKVVTELVSNTSRTWRWTYDAQNRITERTDAQGQVTRYTYDVAGNLTSLNDAAGTTRYTQYSADGLPLSITSPDGLVTTLTYDPRGRLLSLKVGALTTTYSYTVTGLLSTVATPEGNQLTYSYDDARRLTGIRDKLGNSIRYVLNAAGNRTREEVQDTSGSLSATAKRIDSDLAAHRQPVPQAS